MLEVGSIQIKNTKNILVRMRARNTWIRVSGRLLTLTGRLFSLRKIADQEDYKMPATIDDPAILEEITQSLIENKILI